MNLGYLGNLAKESKWLIINFKEVDHDCRSSMRYR
jgi:hypothetical protein